MAERDNSQGFGFVYLDANELLTKRDFLTRDPSGPVPTFGAQTLNFNRDTDRKEARAQDLKSEKREEKPETAPQTPEHKEAVRQIKDNLDRLQSLHHKLHAMLAEINSLTASEKKKR